MLVWLDYAMSEKFERSSYSESTRRFHGIAHRRVGLENCCGQLGPREREGSVRTGRLLQFIQGFCNLLKNPIKLDDTSTLRYEVNTHYATILWTPRRFLKDRGRTGL